MKDYIYLTPLIVPCYVISEVYDVMKKFDQFIRFAKSAKNTLFHNEFKYQQF